MATLDNFLGNFRSLRNGLNLKQKQTKPAEQKPQRETDRDPDATDTNEQFHEKWEQAYGGSRFVQDEGKGVARYLNQEYQLYPGTDSVQQTLEMQDDFNNAMTEYASATDRNERINLLDSYASKDRFGKNRYLTKILRTLREDEEHLDNINDIYNSNAEWAINTVNAQARRFQKRA